MLELEENIRLLEELKAKLQNLGESLWHRIKERRTKEIRRANITRKLLATRYINK